MLYLKLNKNIIKLLNNKENLLFMEYNDFIAVLKTKTILLRYINLIYLFFLYIDRQLKIKNTISIKNSMTYLKIIAQLLKIPIIDNCFLYFEKYDYVSSGNYAKVFKKHNYVYKLRRINSTNYIYSNVFINFLLHNIIFKNSIIKFVGFGINNNTVYIILKLKFNQKYILQDDIKLNKFLIKKKNNDVILLFKKEYKLNIKKQIIFLGKNNEIKKTEYVFYDDKHLYMDLLEKTNNLLKIINIKFLNSIIVYDTEILYNSKFDFINKYISFLYED